MPRPQTLRLLQDVAVPIGGGGNVTRIDRFFMGAENLDGHGAVEVSVAILGQFAASCL